MIGSAIGEIVAIDRCDHDVVQAQFFDREADVARLFGVKRQRFAFVDRAEAAAASAGVAKNQKGRGLVAPAFADVRTARFLTHGVEFFLAH